GCGRRHRGSSLKQLLVVFTPYPGFKAVRKDHSLKKSDQSEQPFFLDLWLVVSGWGLVRDVFASRRPPTTNHLSASNGGDFRPAVIFHLIHSAGHILQSLRPAQLFGQWKEFVLLFVDVALDAFAQVCERPLELLHIRGHG